MDCFHAKTRAKAGPGGWGQRNLPRRPTGGFIGGRQDAMSTRLFNLKSGSGSDDPSNPEVEPNAWPML